MRKKNGSIKLYDIDFRLKLPLSPNKDEEKTFFIADEF